MTFDPTSMIPHLLEEEVEEEEEEAGVPPISTERAIQAAAAALTSCQCEDDNGTTTLNKDDDIYDDIQAKSIVVPSHESHYKNPECLRALEDGGCLFAFTCNHELSPYEADIFNNVINLSAFQDETKENYVPHYEYKDDDEYTFVLARCAYLYVGVDVQWLLANPSFLCDLSYQRCCQPAGTTVWDDYQNMAPDNFRVTKPIIPYLYDFTVQFRVSGNLSREELNKLGRSVGTRVDGAILLERTKRSVPPKEDATKKCKSVLLYTELQEGIFLVTHLTAVLQAGLPEIVERVIDTVGQWGLGETCETAWRTRRYLRKVLPLPVLNAEPSGIVEKAMTPCEEDSESSEDIFYDASENSSSEVER